MIGTPRGLALLLPVCQDQPGPTPPGPSAPILLPGASPSTECERAMVAWPQAALESGWGAETDRTEEALFNACTASEFAAFNEQLDALFRYPDTYLRYNCVDPLQIWPGSRLCESLSGDQASVTSPEEPRLGVGPGLPRHHPRLLGRSWRVPSIDQPGEVGGSTGEVEAFRIAASHGW